MLSTSTRCHRPARPGDPVFQRQRCLSRTAAAYWVPRSSRGTTAEGVDTPSRSRGTKCPRSASFVSLSRREGAGNTGCWPHPRVLRAKKDALCARKQRQGSRDNRRSLRDGLRLIRDLLGVPGFSSLRRLEIISPGLIPASGDRDRTISPSAIRASSLRASRPSHPASRLVTIGRNAPLAEAGRVKTIIFFRKTEAIYFAARGLTRFR